MLTSPAAALHLVAERARRRAEVAEVHARHERGEISDQECDDLAHGPLLQSNQLSEALLEFVLKNTGTVIVRPWPHPVGESPPSVIVGSTLMTFAGEAEELVIIDLAASVRFPGGSEDRP